MNRILLSPTALPYIPILMLHAIVVAYLLRQGRKSSRSTLLIAGWIGGVTVVMASLFLARALYPREARVALWLSLGVLGTVTAGTQGGWQRLVGAWWRPESREARIARAFALLMPAAALSVLASAAEARGALPTGTFALLYLPAIFGLVVYLNHSRR